MSQTYCHWVIVVAMSREETMCESDTLAWKSLSKQGPWRCPSLGCFFKGIQLVGVICLVSRTRRIQGSYHADRIMTVHFNLPHSLCLLTAYLKCTKSVGGAWMWLHFLWKKPSHSLVYIWSAGKAREFEQAWLPLISRSTFSIFNPSPPFFFLLISPIPFSSQVHLAFIHEFSSALELLGLYLKTSPLNKSSRNLLILPAISPLQSFYSGAGAEERQR